MALTLRLDRLSPGASYLRAVAAKAPDRAAEIIAARRDGLVLTSGVAEPPPG